MGYTYVGGRRNSGIQIQFKKYILVMEGYIITECSYVLHRVRCTKSQESASTYDFNICLGSVEN